MGPVHPFISAHCRLQKQDAKKSAHLNPIWDPMTSALLEACPEILNCPITIVMENQLKWTTGWENLKRRTTKSRLLPSRSFHLKPNGLTFTQGRCFLSASCSLMSYIGWYIYDDSISHFWFTQVAITLTLFKAKLWSCVHLQSNILHCRCHAVVMKIGFFLHGSMTLQCLCLTWCI